MNLAPTPEHPVSSPPLAGETVVFTGTLASMVHRDAFLLVEQHGGRPAHSVSRATTMLVVGEEGWPLESDGRTSQKLQQVTQLIADGSEVRIVAESDWLQFLGLDEKRGEIRRAHTPAMLSQLLDIPVRLIRRWARLGLIRPVRRICRLPYFDYREVASARRLAALLEQGVSPATLEHSLTELSHAIADTDHSLAQLNLLVQDDRILMRDERGIRHPRTGQRFLDFDAAETPELRLRSDFDAPDSDDGDPELVSLPFAGTRQTPDDRPMTSWNAEEWFHEGCRLTEETEFESAVNAYRNALSILGAESAAQRLNGEDPSAEPISVFPDPADVHFHLADALYRCGRIEGAMERYFCAIENAPDFIEAWTQLGCIQAECGQGENAEQAFMTALSIHPENSDALLHYAQLLDEQQRNREAAEYWNKYLAHDSRGPWSEHARRRLSELAAVSNDADVSSGAHSQIPEESDDWMSCPAVGPADP